LVIVRASAETKAGLVATELRKPVFTATAVVRFWKRELVKVPPSQSLMGSSIINALLVTTCPGEPITILVEAEVVPLVLFLGD